MEKRARVLDFDSARRALVQHLSPRIADTRVLAAMLRVPRERFLPPDVRHAAYHDRPLPIGLGQTISQPFIVALMTQALALRGDETVLEVGTGSGYQAAVLAELAASVVTVERLPILAEGARRVLQRLGYANVAVYYCPSDIGWRARAPYGGIVVTAASPAVPDALVDQLAPGGRMVIPVGTRFDQDLLLVTRKGRSIARENLGPCRFVPLIGQGAWEEN